MEAISGLRTIEAITAEHTIHPIQMGQWRRQLLENASELFGRGKNNKAKEAGEAKEEELFEQIAKLQMEREWLKKSQLI